MKIYTPKMIHTFNCGGEPFGFRCDISNPSEVKIFDCLLTHKNQTLNSIWFLAYDKKFQGKYRFQLIYLLTKFFMRKWE